MDGPYETGPDEARLPPNEAFAERSVLGALLANFPVAWPQVSDTGLCADEFYLGSHAEIFRRLAWYGWKGGIGDPVLLSSWLEKARPGNSWMDQILELAGSHVTAANVAHYASLVRSAAAKRQIIINASKVREAAYGDGQDLHDHLDATVDAFRVLHEGGVAGRLPTHTAGAFLQQEIGERIMLVGGEVMGQGEWLTLVGEEKTGKSLLALDLACALVREVTDPQFLPTWCGFQVYAPRRVLYLVGEGGRLSFHKRLRKRAQGYTEDELERLHLWFPAPSLMALNDPTDYQAVRNYVLDNGIEVVMLDPLAHFHTLDENSTVDMKVVAGRIIELKEDTGCAVLAVHHTRKATLGSRRGSPREGRGSTVLVGANDGSIVFEHENQEDEQDPERRITMVLRNAENAPAPMKVQLSKSTLKFEVVTRSIGDTRPAGGRPTEHGTQPDDVLDYLGVLGPCTYDQLAQGMDVPKRTLQRWLPELETYGKVGKSRRGPRVPYTWHLPGQVLPENGQADEGGAT